MADKNDVWQGTLALMVLKTLETIGPLHGYGVARRIKRDQLAEGFSTESMINTSTGPLADSSFNPSCSCMAAKIVP